MYMRLSLIAPLLPLLVPVRAVDYPEIPYREIQVLNYDTDLQEAKFSFPAPECVEAKGDGPQELIFTLRPEKCLMCNDIWLNDKLLTVEYDLQSRQQYYRTASVSALDAYNQTRELEITYYSNANDIIGGFDGNHPERRFIVPNPDERFEATVSKVDGKDCSRALTFHFTLLLDDPLRRIHIIGVDNMAREHDVDFTKLKNGGSEPSCPGSAQSSGASQGVVESLAGI